MKIKLFAGALSVALLTASVITVSPAKTQPNVASASQNSQAGCPIDAFYVPSWDTCIDIQVISDADCLANAECVSADVLYWRYRNTDQAAAHPSIHAPAPVVTPTPTPEPTPAPAEAAPTNSCWGK